MDALDIGPLPPHLAEAADAIIDAVISAAASEVTATRRPLNEAMDNAWGRMAERYPEVWALAVLRLRETGNEEMLCWADPDVRR